MADTETNTHPLHDSFTVYYSVPNKETKKKKSLAGNDFMKSIGTLCDFNTVEGFWATYQHVIRPNFAGDIVENLQIFRTSIRPQWEDPANSGGRFTIHLRKGFAAMYWEALMLAFVGGQFGELNEQVNGLVIGIRAADDIMYIWTRSKEEAVVQALRDRVGELLQLTAKSQSMIEFKPFNVGR